MTRKRTSENDMAVSSGASSAPLRRKSGSRTRAKHTPTTGDAAEPEIASPLSAAAVTISEPSVAVVSELGAVTVTEPNRDDIARLAFLYWEARGYQGGSSEEDWLRAEQELRLR